MQQGEWEAKASAGSSFSIFPDNTKREKMTFTDSAKTSDKLLKLIRDEAEEIPVCAWLRQYQNEDDSQFMRPNSTADGCQNIADASGLSIKSLGSYDRSLKGWPITVQGSVKAYVASYQTGGLYDPKYREPMEADSSKYCQQDEQSETLTCASYTLQDVDLTGLKMVYSLTGEQASVDESESNEAFVADKLFKGYPIWKN
ncbi:hypothetical protein KIH79_11050 [Bifidobacterium sp. 82T10]|uniref:Lipoprotein n=1 Tax=Bifidobacterium miconis TaxID=2834435 RepID=A0ABS6WHC0_9BIFI|nr:hypothetical protein [Bifidobacterium miconis]MBW3093446.1 hypothetical protein [Bifidobacterium miconis]